MPISLKCKVCDYETVLHDRSLGVIHCGSCGSRISEPDVTRKFLWRFDRSAAAVMLLAAVFSVLFMVVAPFVQNARAAALRHACVENVRQLTAAINAYEQEHHTLPPAYTVDASGNRLHSWRVLILPYLGCNDLYSQFRLNEPWNSEWNIALADQMPDVFHCPAAPHARNLASYKVIVGKETAFSGSEGRPLSAILDGPCGTLFVVEAGHSRVIWTEPQDIDFSKMNFQPNSDSDHCISGGHTEDVVNVAFGNGKAQSLRSRTDPRVVEAMVTADGREPLCSCDDL